MPLFRFTFDMLTTYFFGSKDVSATVSIYKAILSCWPLGLIPVGPYETSYSCSVATIALRRSFREPVDKQIGGRTDGLQQCLMLLTKVSSWLHVNTYLTNCDCDSQKHGRNFSIINLSQRLVDFWKFFHCRILKKIMCYISSDMVVRNVSNSKSNLQDHWRSLQLLSFDRPYMISCSFSTKYVPVLYRFDVLSVISEKVKKSRDLQWYSSNLNRNMNCKDCFQ